MKLIKCPHCNEETDKSAKFCQHCGQKIKKKRNYSVLFTFVITTLLTTAVCSLSFFYIYDNYLIDLKDVIVETEVVVTDEGISDAVSKVYDAVVTVYSYQNDTLYSTGSGFVFDSDDEYGYILTNAHVIDGATSTKVMFTDKNEVDAEIIGYDTISDIAVLKVDIEHVLLIASLGDSTDMLVGDTTFAVGAPLDSSTYSWTVTRGIISGVDRLVEVEVDSSYIIMNVMQTDTAINSGNSGGPLCNSNGEIIGITNMKLVSSDSSIEGMGFAIPIETALEYANNFIDEVPITRPFLGVATYDVSTLKNNGIYIDSVTDSSPADLSGMQKGDYITEVNGEIVKTSSYLKYELYKYDVGEEITITILRDDEEIVLEVVLGSQNIVS
ncbi:MAG: trypsin-like peptidase domain-containing protein [Mycoplasmatota bacterium]